MTHNSKVAPCIRAMSSDATVTALTLLPRVPWDVARWGRLCSCALLHGRCCRTGPLACPTFSIIIRQPSSFSLLALRRFVPNFQWHCLPHRSDSPPHQPYRWSPLPQRLLLPNDLPDPIRHGLQLLMLVCALLTSAGPWPSRTPLCWHHQARQPRARVRTD